MLAAREVQGGQMKTLPHLTTIDDELHVDMSKVSSVVQQGAAPGETQRWVGIFMQNGRKFLATAEEWDKAVEEYCAGQELIAEMVAYPGAPPDGFIGEIAPGLRKHDLVWRPPAEPVDEKQREIVRAVRKASATIKEGDTVWLDWLGTPRECTVVMGACYGTNALRIEVLEYIVDVADTEDGWVAFLEFDEMHSKPCDNAQEALDEAGEILGYVKPVTK